MIKMSFVESDVAWEDWGCLMVLSDNEKNVNKCKSATTMDSTLTNNVNKKVYILPEVVLDGVYLFSVGNDVISCNLVIRVFDVVVGVVSNFFVVVVDLDVVPGVSSTLIFNVQFPVWPLLPVA